MKPVTTKELVPLIIEASTDDQAIAILTTISKILGVDSAYSTLMQLKQSLSEYKHEFKLLEDRFKKLKVPRAFQEIQEIRLEAGYLYTTIVDGDVIREISRLKTFYDETRSVAKSESILDLSKREDITSKDGIGAKSASAIGEIYGVSEIFKQYRNKNAIAYSLWQDMQALSTAMNNLINAIASEERYLLKINSQDI